MATNPRRTKPSLSRPAAALLPFGSQGGLLLSDLLDKGWPHPVVGLCVDPASPHWLPDALPARLETWLAERFPDVRVDQVIKRDIPLKGRHKGGQVATGLPVFEPVFLIEAEPAVIDQMEKAMDADPSMADISECLYLLAHEVGPVAA